MELGRRVVTLPLGAGPFASRLGLSVASLTQTVTSASESSCLLSRKLFKIPRRVLRHEKSSKCCRHWKHLYQVRQILLSIFQSLGSSVRSLLRRSCLRSRWEFWWTSCSRMCHSETSTWKQTTQAATPTSSGAPNIIELSRLHVMIDHLMVRGPKAEQTPLGLRSVPRQGQERVTRRECESSFCPRQRQGCASPSHRRGPRALVFHANGLCAPSWYNAADHPLGSLARFLQNGLAESSTRSRSYGRVGKSYHWLEVARPTHFAWEAAATKLGTKGPRLMSIYVLLALRTSLRTRAVGSQETKRPSGTASEWGLSLNRPDARPWQVQTFTTTGELHCQFLLDACGAETQDARSSSTFGLPRHLSQRATQSARTNSGWLSVA